jgi:hypothetical protein
MKRDAEAGRTHADNSQHTTVNPGNSIVTQDTEAKYVWTRMKHLERFADDRADLA